jgi:hypothetical protein
VGVLPGKPDGYGKEPALMTVAILGLAVGVVLAAGLIKWRILPAAVGTGAVIRGLAAMVLTMDFPDNEEYYAPVFHLNALWLLATGLVMLRSGLRLGPQAGDH